MPNKPYKKPSLEQLEAVLKVTGGILSRTAEILGCCRLTLRRWIRSDPEFADAIYDARMRTFDSCLSSAQLLAFGVPITENGQLKGWKERPDVPMLIFLMKKLGREEGFDPDHPIMPKNHKQTDMGRWIEHEMNRK